MTRTLTEREVLAEFLTPQQYQDFAMDVYQQIVNSDAFKKSDPICFCIQNYEIDKNTFLHVEATLKKLSGGAHDFGFVKFVVTDDFDFTLDRWNEAKKITNS